jgi:hypothetical protein
MYSNYPIFAEYHYFTKKWLEDIMRLTRLGTTKIPVVYNTPRRAFAIGSTSLGGPGTGTQPLYAPPSEGNNFLPILTFNLTGMTQKMEKTRPYEYILVTPIKDNNNTVSAMKQNKPLQVYEINYTAHLYTALMQDADILMFKFASEFKPQCYLWIGDQTAIGDGTKGLYAHMLLDSITDGSEYEPGDIAERVIRKDLNWRVTEAYVPTLEVDVNDQIIEEFKNELYT